MNNDHTVKKSMTSRKRDRPVGKKRRLMFELLPDKRIKDCQNYGQ